MLNKKFIIAITALLLAGCAYADSNDLLRMDVKRSSMNDAVDVTFYTTGTATNSVVTRKGDNRYVVLLPNVAGSPTVAPNIGGVKDLITNIDVKNVDDGIGGYTKVTFTTTKPVKIQTSTKKTAPLTQAQQDYKNLIAQNSKYDPDKRLQNFKGTTATTASVAAAAKPAVPATVAKPATPVQTKPAATSKPTTGTTTAKPVTQVKQTTTQTKIAQATKPVVTPTPVKQAATSTPKITETKPEAKVEPPQEDVVPKIEETKNDIEKVVQPETQTIPSKPEKKGFPVIPLAGLASVCGLFLLALLFNILSRSIVKQSKRYKMPERETAPVQNNKDEYTNIMNDESLNWQEKYKLYAEKEEKQKPKKQDYTFVTNAAADKTAVVDESPVKKINKTTALKTVTSHLEHAYNQVQKEPTEVNNDVKSEDLVISEGMSKVKLKSFAKPLSLGETDRTITPNKKSVTKPFKESRFVKLRNSALSMSRRNSGNSELNISDLLRTGHKYLNNETDGVVTMNAKSNYATSSLNEYMSILDKEGNQPKTEISTDTVKTLPKMKSEGVMSRSGITNPMKKVNPMHKPSQTSVNGLSVKSGYDIDENRGFYLVDSEGSSAIVGRINDEVFVLKKFDRVINSSLQVRLDYGNVYIVRCGGFKCLVDVSEEKMGTLLEI